MLTTDLAGLGALGYAVYSVAGSWYKFRSKASQRKEQLGPFDKLAQVGRGTPGCCVRVVCGNPAQRGTAGRGQALVLLLLLLLQQATNHTGIRSRGEGSWLGKPPGGLCTTGCYINITTASHSLAAPPQQARSPHV